VTDVETAQILGLRQTLLKVTPSSLAASCNRSCASVVAVRSAPVAALLSSYTPFPILTVRRVQPSKTWRFVRTPRRLSAIAANTCIHCLSTAVIGIVGSVAAVAFAVARPSSSTTKSTSSPPSGPKSFAVCVLGGIVDGAADGVSAAVARGSVAAGATGVATVVAAGAVAAGAATGVWAVARASRRRLCGRRWHHWGASQCQQDEQERQWRWYNTRDASYRDRPARAATAI
jgi:hypothetical protein